MSGPPLQLSQSLEDGKSMNASECHLETVERTTTVHGSSVTANTWQVLVDNPKVIIICLFANTGALMYGFDNLALSLCLSMAPFEKQFGSLVGEKYLIPAYWQSLWNSLAQVATMLGALSTGLIADRFGRRAAFLVAGFVSAAGVAVVYTAATPGVFLAGKMVNGLALGLSLATGQTYISEIAPTKIRGIALAAFTFCLNLGYLIAASIAFKRLTMTTQAAYKVLFASAWVWPCLLILFSFVIPESPYYLIQKDHLERAEKAISRLYNKNTHAPSVLHEIKQLDETEKWNSESMSYVALFKGVNWRRTRIILYCNGISQMIGASFNANGPYFLVSAGMDPHNIAMIIELGIGFGIISSVITYILMGRVGRKTMIIFGLLLSTLLFLIMGIAGCFPTSKNATWAIGITLQLTWWTFGPVISPAMSVAGEISETRLRAKSQSVGFMFNYFFSTVWNVVVPYMFNPDQGNLGGKIGWIYFGTCLISLIVVYLEFPETINRTYAELDVMFNRRIPARKFAEYDVNSEVEVE